MGAARSLKARALQLLAQREQSRPELWRKLMTHAMAEDEARHAADGPGSLADPNPDAQARVDALLDWLEAHRYLSQERFVESRVHARAAKFGNLRIRQELAQHHATLSPEAAQTLRDSELDRARAVWARKFPMPAASAVEHAKQARFLAGRGFSPDTIRRVLRR
jgi:regulatory protein